MRHRSKVAETDASALRGHGQLDKTGGELRGRSIKKDLFIGLCSLFVSLIVSNLIWGDTFYYKLRSKSAIERRKRAHDEALAQATAFLNSLTPHDATKWSNSNTTTPQICISIASKQRKVPYIQVLLASLLKGNDPKELSSVVLHILNSEDPAEANTDLALIQQKLPFVHFHTDAVKQSKTSSSSIDRHNHDYASLLNVCLETTAHWIFAVEEDMVLSRDFLPKAIKLLDPLLNQDTTAFVKLFVSDRWDGFENKDIGHILLVCSIISLGLTKVFAPRSNKCRIYLYIFVWLAFMLFVNTVLAGRQNLSMFHDRVLRVKQRVIPLQHPFHEAAGCLMAYNRAAAERARNYLLHSAAAHKQYFDVLLSREYLDDNPNLKAYEVIPPLAQHIGAYSSFKGKNHGDFAFLGQNEAFQDGVF